MIITELKRVFKLKRKGETIVLDDPNPSFSPEEVLSFYTGSYPELTTSTVGPGQVVNDQYEYEFTTTVGTKG